MSSQYIMVKILSQFDYKSIFASCRQGYVLYVQEVVTLQKKMRFTPFINYYSWLLEYYSNNHAITILEGEYYSYTEQNNFRSHELNWMK